MLTKYHFTSAQEIDSGVLQAIKDTFKSKAITIIVKEDEECDKLTESQKMILEERLQEDEETYFSAERSMAKLNKKYGLLRISSNRSWT